MAAEMHRRIHGGGDASEKEAKIDSVISTFDCIFVDFYAPSSGHCKRLNPELYEYLNLASFCWSLVKYDCVFGDDFNLEEITFVSEVLKELDRPVLYSISPGTSVTPTMAKEVSQLVNMYRITGDDWDTWKDVAAHFDISRDFVFFQMVEEKGLSSETADRIDNFVKEKGAPLELLTKLRQEGKSKWTLILGVRSANQRQAVE